MRESIGTTFMLNFIIFFLVLVFAFLMGTFSYYKAYRVNNMMVQAIEKYEGWNYLSARSVDEAIASFGYQTEPKINCPKDMESSRGGRTIKGTLVKDPALPDSVCIYEFMGDTEYVSSTDVYYTYGIQTYMRFTFPVVQWMLRIPIFSRTYRMYCFGGCR